MNIVRSVAVLLGTELPEAFFWSTTLVSAVSSCVVVFTSVRIIIETRREKRARAEKEQ